MGRSYIFCVKFILLDSVLKLLVADDLLCEHISTGLGALNHLNDLGH